MYRTLDSPCQVPFDNYFRMRYVRCMDVPAQVERLIAQAGSMVALAERTGLSRQTIYNLKRGGWPSAKAAKKLGLKIAVGK